MRKIKSFFHIFAYQLQTQAIDHTENLHATLLRQASNESDVDSRDSDVDPNLDFVADSVRHPAFGKIKINRVSNFEKTVPIVIKDVIAHMEPDSGADVV